MKKLVAIAVLFAALAGAVYAQGTGMTGWTSPQSAATQGRMRSAADDFIRPDSYTSAGVKDWFAMTSFASTSSVSLGYAKKLEKVYLAAYYGGTFWANITPFNYNESYDTAWPGGGKTVQDYTSLDFNATRPANRIGLLLGVADMGFRLSFYSTHETFKGSDILQGTNRYKNYEADFGVIQPQLAWSMTKNLTSNGIKPYVTFDLAFDRNYQKYEIATADSSAGEQIGRSANYVSPIFMAGLGGYTFVNKDSFRASADLDYTLTIRAYENEYSYLDTDGKYKISKISGLNQNDALTENSYVSNLITPSVSGQWSNGPLAFRFKLNMNFTITNQEISAMTINDRKLVKNGEEYTSVYFGFNPDLRLAMQWRIIPKLALNAGGRINIQTVGVTTVEGKNYANDSAVNDSSFKRVTNVYGAASNQLTAGATFNPAEYLTFEAACGVGSNNNISVFSDTGLFSFSNILVSLKF